LTFTMEIHTNYSCQLILSCNVSLHILVTE
jgi:hypothetical protein